MHSTTMPALLIEQVADDEEDEPLTHGALRFLGLPARYDMHLHMAAIRAAPEGET